ncbi:hypothetical protein P691DRAFT_768482 [Macrolepiota fuliginosa MF-IS2]|uniref:Uncharacterized protein n=1 Tax=Macrolepiota fuliginosa MF-IS2 TaxID=1400762 RepID=A0A9P6BVX5_9AGAR|nr:hypothetical protein P691DRAFT_768482 [Macrolepiota fuliginosa MF-IS2]
MGLVPFVWRDAIQDDLNTMCFQIMDQMPTSPAPASTPSGSSTLPEDASDNDNELADIINSVTTIGQWCQENVKVIVGDVEHCNALKSNIHLLTDIFGLIPAPHQCPTPPPCSLPHWSDNNIPMEPPAPICTFSEAASQTPASSHEATCPLPPPPAAVASLPAAAASSASAGPCG